MQVPLEISYRNINKTEEIDQLISDKVNSLERVHDHITSCRIAIEKTQQHQRQGTPYRIRIAITVPPGHEIVVKREPSKGILHRKLSAVIRDAFSAARRQLKELEKKQRGAVKVHAYNNHNNGFIKAIFPFDGYGFITTLDNREVYFHQNSVLHNDFDRLEIGTGVRYVEEMGDQGPQASTVQIVDKPGSRIDA
ncbi:HPF/RaiA family ribosome-associated protein [candidate division KSB1 bacterium]|nr:HPF/RaiA family ribosome-associated protein [candidate division KSB1 bacterium]